MAFRGGPGRTHGMPSVGLGSRIASILLWQRVANWCIAPGSRRSQCGNLPAVEERAMVACRILLASVLLSSSPDSQPPDAPHVCHAELAPSVRRLALEWQIVDARELDRILVDAQDFQ